MNGELIQRIVDAANRALLASEELHAMVDATREVGFEVEASVKIEVKRCAPAPNPEWLEALYQLQDPRTR
jgi:hypothetical protein